MYTIVTLQFTYGGLFVRPVLRLDSDADVLRFTNSLKVVDFDITDSDDDSLYDIDENVEDLSDFDENLLQVRKCNIAKQVKEKSDRVNLDEIPSGPVGIDVGFEEICKNKGVKYEDENNQMYLVAWAVVDKETKDTWSWFLRRINHDLKLKEMRVFIWNLLIYCQMLSMDGVLDIYGPTGSRFGEVKKGGKNSDSDASPMAMKVLAENGKYAAKFEVRFNGDFGFELGDPPYTHVINVKRKQCSYVAKSTRPPIEPPEITPMLGRPSKNRKKARNEPIKNKFGNASKEKENDMFSVQKKDFAGSCGSQPSMQPSTNTAVAAAVEIPTRTSGVDMPSNAKLSKIRPAGRPADATNAHSAPTVVGRPVNVASISGVRPATASTADIRPTVVVMPAATSVSHNISTKGTETDLVHKQLDADKQGTRQQSRNTSMGSRKSNVPTQVVPPLRVKLLSDFSFEKQLDGDNQLKKQNHKGFKKMDTAPEKKREEQKECTSGLNKSMLPPLMKMNNEATKKHNCRSITRPMQRSAVARPKQKETENISDMKKFESSKKKFEERFTEQKESKRRIVMVDFHDMPKPAKDPRAPT
ncbi:hypothetical protein FXO37_26944 [Capsicum annuum]|nr:hypothetical protein FXO37_26944 [Capsicum annuum]